MPRSAPELFSLIHFLGNLGDKPSKCRNLYDRPPDRRQPRVPPEPAVAYESVRREHRGICWRFHERPLGFAGAIQDGLKVVRYDWVCLLNSDVVLDPLALHALAPERSPSTFSLASQIALKDLTRYRDETNWTTLFVEGGLAVIHDRIPTVSIPVPAFYARRAGEFVGGRFGIAGHRGDGAAPGGARRAGLPFPGFRPFDPACVGGIEIACAFGFAGMLRHRCR